MKVNYFILIALFLLALTVCVVAVNSNNSNRFESILEEEERKREKLNKQIDLLKIEKKYLDLSIDDMKKHADDKNKALQYIIQEIKNKSNVQVRDVTDSSFVFLLKELQPK